MRLVFQKTPFELLGNMPRKACFIAALAVLACGPSACALDRLFAGEGDATPMLSPQEANDASYPGEWATDFLSDTNYRSLLIEIDYMDHHKPDEDAINDLVDAIESLCNKPDGVTVEYSNFLPDEGAVDFTYDDVQALEDSYRDHYKSGDQAVVYFLFLSGYYSDDSGSTQTVGFAHHASSLAIFMGVVEEQAATDTVWIPGTGWITYSPQSYLTEAVSIHEVGHTWGLVNIGIPMVEDHLDSNENAAGAHCDDPDCVMYWLASDASALDDFKEGGPDFDYYCRLDIAAAGGKDTVGYCDDFPDDDVCR